MEDQTFGSYAREIRKEISNYVEARLEYAKLLAYEKTAKAIAVVTNIIVLAAFGFFTFFFVSITLALYLGKWLNDVNLGFAIISAFDLMVFLIFVMNKGKIEKMVTNKIIEQLLKEKHKEENKPDDDPLGRTK